MIPVITTVAYKSPYTFKQGRRSLPLEAWCVGDHTIGEAAVLKGEQWKLTYTDPDFVLTRVSDGYTTTVYSSAGAVHVSLAFDQAMQPVLAWEDGDGNMHIAVPSVGEYSRVALGPGKSPLLALDIIEVRDMAGADVVLSYMRGRDLYVRVQRESYAIEHLRQADAGKALVRFGKSNGNRLQWDLLP